MIANLKVPARVTQAKKLVPSHAPISMQHLFPSNLTIPCAKLFRQGHVGDLDELRNAVPTRISHRCRATSIRAYAVAAMHSTIQYLKHAQIKDLAGRTMDKPKRAACETNKQTRRNPTLRRRYAERVCLCVQWKSDVSQRHSNGRCCLPSLLPPPLHVERWYDNWFEYQATTLKGLCASEYSVSGTARSLTRFCATLLETGSDVAEKWFRCCLRQH